MRASIIAVMTLSLMFAGCSAPLTAVDSAPPTPAPNAAIAAEPELDPIIASITQQRRDHNSTAGRIQGDPGRYPDLPIKVYNQLKCCQ